MKFRPEKHVNTDCMNEFLSLEFPIQVTFFRGSPSRRSFVLDRSRSQQALYLSLHNLQRRRRRLLAILIFGANFFPCCCCCCCVLCGPPPGNTPERVSVCVCATQQQGSRIFHVKFRCKNRYFLENLIARDKSFLSPVQSKLFCNYLTTLVTEK